MGFESLLKEKALRLESVPADFATAATKAQADALKSVVKELEGLDYVKGKLALTKKNLAKIAQIGEKLRSTLVGGEYMEAVIAFAKEFPAQSKLTMRFFESGFGKLNDNNIYQATLDAAQADTIAFLDEGAVMQQFVLPLRQKITQSIISGASFTDTVKALEQVAGAGQKHVVTAAKDGFALFDRSYTHRIAEDKGVEWYKYTGGILDSTRPFCKERNGKYFHKSEIEAWADNKWSGKIEGTNKATIFQFAGGYGCHHSILPVPESAVPKADLERVKKKETASANK
jgi:hypothetical protein